MATIPDNELAALRMRQVWAVVYDGDPLMNGGHERRQLSERTTLEAARRDVDILNRRSTWPLPGLRIETRTVTEWEPLNE